MNPKKPNDAFGSAEIDFERIAELEREIAAFETQKTELEEGIKKLMFEEDIAAGKTFAAEIHEKRHDKMRVEVEILALRQKVRRLQLGFDEDAVPDYPTGEGAL